MLFELCYYAIVFNKFMWMLIIWLFFNPSSAKFTKWSNTLKRFVGKLNCLSVFDYFVGLALKGLTDSTIKLCEAISPCTDNKKNWFEEANPED